MQMQERRMGSVRGRLALPPRGNFTFAAAGVPVRLIPRIEFVGYEATLLATFRLSTEETVYSAFDRPGNIVDQRHRRLINPGPCHYCH
jgi:hypothetical protein